MSKKSNRVTHEQLLEAAAQSLKLYGTLVPPRELLYPVMEKLCPHCGEIKPIVSGFGLGRTVTGQRPHPWCKQCRNSKDSHPTRYGMPKKNRSSADI